MCPFGSSKHKMEKLAKQLGSVDQELQLAAFTALRKIDDHWFRSEEVRTQVPDFIAALGDKNRDTRRGAVDALRLIAKRWWPDDASALASDSRAVGALIIALTDEDEQVRKLAAEALGEIGDPGAVVPLIAVLRDGSRAERYLAASALEKINDPRALGPLIAALRYRDEDVRVMAYQALEKVDPKWPISEEAIRQIPDFESALKEPDRAIRKAAAWALTKITDPARAERLNPADFLVE